MKAFFSLQTKQFVLYIVIIIATLLGLWLVYLLRDVLSLVLLSCFAALLLSPFVSRLNTWKIPQIPAILTTFLGLLVILSLFVVSIIPIFVRLAEDSKGYVLRSIDFIEAQAQDEFPVLDKLPFHAGSMIRKGIDIPELTAIVLDKNRVQLVTENITNNIDTLKNFAQNGIGQVGSIGVSFASGLTSFITLFSLFLLLTFFILLERRAFLKWFFAILPHQLGHYFKSREHTIGEAIHAWLRGQLILATFMFAINFIGLAIAQFFGLPVTNIFSLALIA